jgi:hypothetical protein
MVRGMIIDSWQVENAEWQTTLITRQPLSGTQDRLSDRDSCYYICSQSNRLLNFAAFISVSLRLREKPPSAISQRSSPLPIRDIRVIRGHPPRGKFPFPSTLRGLGVLRGKTTARKSPIRVPLR